MYLLPKNFIKRGNFNGSIFLTWGSTIGCTKLQKSYSTLLKHENSNVNGGKSTKNDILLPNYKRQRISLFLLSRSPIFFFSLGKIYFPHTRLIRATKTELISIIVAVDWIVLQSLIWGNESKSGKKISRLPFFFGKCFFRHMPRWYWPRWDLFIYFFYKLLCFFCNILFVYYLSCLCVRTKYIETYKLNWVLPLLSSY